jgi:hypothetical protein
MAKDHILERQRAAALRLRQARATDVVLRMRVKRGNERIARQAKLLDLAELDDTDLRLALLDLLELAAAQAERY